MYFSLIPLPFVSLFSPLFLISSVLVPPSNFFPPFYISCLSQPSLISFSSVSRVFLFPLMIFLSITLFLIPLLLFFCFLFLISISFLCFLVYFFLIFVPHLSPLCLITFSSSTCPFAICVFSLNSVSFLSHLFTINLLSLFSRLICLTSISLLSTFVFHLFFFNRWLSQFCLVYFSSVSHIVFFSVQSLSLLLLGHLPMSLSFISKASFLSYLSPI